MGRYGRRQPKKTGTPTFLVIAIVASLLVGVVSTLYLLKRVNENTFSTDVKPAEIQNENLIAQENRPEEATLTDENQLEIQPIEPAPVVKDVQQKPIEPVELPALMDSDEVFRQTVIQLSPGLKPWFNYNLLIRRYIEIVNDFSQGQRLHKHMDFLWPDDRFTIEQGEKGPIIAPKSYHRFDKLTQAIQQVDVRNAVSVYLNFRPLMLEVFKEFSYPNDFTLETIVKKAAAEVLAAPIVDGTVLLTRPSVFYKYADPKLEALNPVQKQMIRMGPDNTRVIQAKVREFLVELAKADIR
jgi:hypothetical protein